MNTIEFLKRGWDAVKVAFTTISSLTVTVDATAKTMTRSSGSWISDGIEVGQRVTTSGFDDSGNNGTFEVTAVTATVMTVGNATGLADVTDDTSVSVHIGDIRVRSGRTLLGRIRVITTSDDVTPYDDETAIWDAIDSTAEFDIGCTPLFVKTSLRVVCTTPAEAWILYKEI